MKNAFAFWVLAIMAAAVPATASESFRYQMMDSASATGRVYATIVMPVSMNTVKDMSFGMMVKNKDGFVELDRAGNRLSSGPGLATSTPSSGAVQIKGPQGHWVAVSVPESNIYDNDSNALEFKPIITPKYRTIALNNHNGEATLKIGGTLTFNHNQISGGTKKGFYIVQASY